MFLHSRYVHIRPSRDGRTSTAADAAATITTTTMQVCSTIFERTAPLLTCSTLNTPSNFIEMRPLLLGTKQNDGCALRYTSVTLITVSSIKIKMIFSIITLVQIQTEAFSVRTPRRSYQHFGETCCLHLQDRRVLPSTYQTTWGYKLEHHTEAKHSLTLLSYIG